jgi:hypothetical protein
METWLRRQGRTLTLAGYAEAGGVRSAVARTAESVYAQLTTQEQSLARSIFLRLTELGEGTQETRRRAPLAELVPSAELTGHSPGVEAQMVLKTLADARLITTTAETAEVAHEALIREWGRLQDWLNEDREGLHLHADSPKRPRNGSACSMTRACCIEGAPGPGAGIRAGAPSTVNALEKAFCLRHKRKPRRQASERKHNASAN